MINEPAGLEEIREVVLAVNDLAAQAHKELYAFEASRYRISGTDLFASLLSVFEKGADRLHIVADWENLLRIALWSPGKPPLFDVLSLLKKSGAAEAELQPFGKAEISDLLPWLYYGRKFDILRRLCHAARSKAEAKANRKGMHVYCHLVSDESRCIIASSL
ncbi:MAG: hypothetical protein HZB31_07820 [Nitrospirae bacterium]|nr:hypothetical protein [Nitrospirota bacterium]